MFIFNRRIPILKHRRQQLLEIADHLRSKGFANLEKGYINDKIWFVHGTIEIWAKSGEIADAMLQTMSIDVRVIQKSDGRAGEDSSSHPDTYDDQRNHGPKSSPEAACLGLIWLCEKLAQEEAHDPVALLCELINVRYERETRLRNKLYSMRDWLTDEDNVFATDSTAKLRDIFGDDIEIFEKLTWSGLK